MTKFRNTFLGLIDRAAEHSKQIVESLDKAASDFNFGDINKEFETRFGSLLSSGREFLNKIDEAARFARDTNKPFVVTLEFDEARGEEYKYSVKGNAIKVEVSYNSETETSGRSKMVTVPEGYDMSRVDVEVDEGKKLLKISVPVLDDEDTEHTAEEEEIPMPQHEVETPSAAANAEETPSTTNESLEKTVDENLRKATAARMRRTADGRFCGKMDA